MVALWNGNDRGTPAAMARIVEYAAASPEMAFESLRTSGKPVIGELVARNLSMSGKRFNTRSTLETKPASGASLKVKRSVGSPKPASRNA
jgi:hypothetical protein